MKKMKVYFRYRTDKTIYYEDGRMDGSDISSRDKKTVEQLCKHFIQSTLKIRVDCLYILERSINLFKLK